MITFLDHYAQYCLKVTDAPPEFHDFLALSTAGCVIGRKRYFQFGHQRIYPNFFILILAPTSLFRKSTCLTISKDLIYQVNPTLVFPSDFSVEKICEVLKQNPVGTFFYYEFRSLMTMLQKDYMQSAKSFLTELFDCGSISIARKSESFSVESPCASIVAATTADWFVNSIKDGDVEGGFLNRFLFVYSKNKLRDDSLPAEPDLSLKNWIVKDLARLDQLAEYKVNLSADAYREYDLWYKSFSKDIEKVPISFRSLFSRLTLYVIKIAIVIETCESLGVEISLNTIKRSIHLVNWVCHSMFALCEQDLAFTIQEKWEKKILKIIAERKLISRSDLIHQSHLSKNQFDSTIATLLDKNQIQFTYRETSGKNRKTQFFEFFNKDLK